MSGLVSHSKRKTSQFLICTEVRTAICSHRRGQTGGAAVRKAKADFSSGHAGDFLSRAEPDTQLAPASSRDDLLPAGRGASVENTEAPPAHERWSYTRVSVTCRNTRKNATGTGVCTPLDHVRNGSLSSAGPQKNGHKAAADGVNLSKSLHGKPSGETSPRYRGRGSIRQAKRYDRVPAPLAAREEIVPPRTRRQICFRNKARNEKRAKDIDKT
ncbi:hypothetical protein MRX96_004899 [Rhipicephalus microplus]